MTTRPQSLRVVAECWLQDLQAEHWERIEVVDELAAALPEPEPRQIAELAAEHMRLLVVNVPPYERLFLGAAQDDPSAWSRELSRLYASFAWMVPAAARSVDADHIGVQLLALSAATEAGNADVARNLVADHLAAWLPLLAWATRRLQPAPFYSCLVELTLDMVLSRLTDTAAGLPAAAEDAAPPGIEALLWPSACGCYISRGELLRIAQWLCVPPPSGGRSDVLVGLVRAADDRDVFTALRGALDNLLEDARLDYEGLAADYPAWRRNCSEWQRRLDSGGRVVAGLRPLA